MNSIIVKLEGEVPSKKNSRNIVKAGNGRRYVVASDAYTRWHRAVMPILRAMAPAAPVSSPVKVIIEFVHGDRRRRDHNNQAASVMDALVDAGILADDSWTIVREESYSGFYEQGNAGCEIWITEI